jgi:hypothetical protein
MIFLSSNHIINESFPFWISFSFKLEINIRENSGFDPQNLSNYGFDPPTFESPELILRYIEKSEMIANFEIII